MSEQCAYRTTDAEVLAWIERMKSSRWVSEILAIAAAHGLDTSVECGVLCYSNGALGGFDYPKVPAELPKGWRRDKRNGAVVPDKRLAAGKAVDKALKDHGRPPSVRDIPGMASEVWRPKGGDGRGSFSYTVVYPAAFEHDGAVYVLFNAPRELVEDADRRMAAGVPDERWEPIKLSEYHLALEVVEAAA